MTRTDLLTFMRTRRYATQASVSADGSPQAAVVGIAVTDNLEIVFDTLDSTRKAINLRHNSRIAFVIGGSATGDERTVQYEGVADEPTGDELERLKKIYFRQFPDGPERLKWPGIMYLRTRPIWIRFSDYNPNPPEVIEFGAREINQLVAE